MPHIEHCNGISLHYESIGSGSALVFLHAYPTNRTIWYPQLTTFSVDYRAIAYDLRGFGLSQVPEDPNAYGTELSIGDLLGLLNKLEIDKAVLCGLSMGGNIALHFALNHPDRVSGLIMADTGAGSEDAQLFADTTNAWADVAENDGIDRFANFVLANPLFAEYADRGLDERKFLYDIVSANTICGIAHTARRVLALRPPIYAIEQKLNQLMIPVLVIVGEADPACIPVSQYMSEQIPGATLVVIPNAGHFNNLEIPETFNHAVQAFLSGLNGY